MGNKEEEGQRSKVPGAVCELCPNLQLSPDPPSTGQKPNASAKDERTGLRFKLHTLLPAGETDAAVLSLR